VVEATATDTPTPTPTPTPESTPADVAASEGSGAEVSLVSVDDLPIAGYDSLSASQVVGRLAALTVDELDAVESYETAHRSRRTILAKVAQLRTRGI
jgi:hypothetical protein